MLNCQIVLHPIFTVLNCQIVLHPIFTVLNCQIVLHPIFTVGPRMLHAQMNLMPVVRDSLYNIS